MEKNEVDLEMLFKNLRKVSYQKVPKGLENKIFCDAKTEIQKRTRDKKLTDDWKIHFLRINFSIDQLGGYLGLGFMTSCLTLGVLAGSIGNDFLYNSDLFGQFFIYSNGDPTEALLNDIELSNIPLFKENQDD
tara:strand:+ start:193 stop:591 length:399 start_codon:yes stop_codon:yes gene_type:complete